MALTSVPKLSLGLFPTPLQRLSSLEQELGFLELWAKRDDLTGGALGGNKVRKLEYELAEALRREADTLLTVGGPQSNHACLTAAMGRKLGLETKLVLGGKKPDELTGNLYLDKILGAEIRFWEGVESGEVLEAEMQKWSEELKANGKRPYTIALGASTGLGALGYVSGMKELAEQWGERKVQLVIAVGSCGSFAGCILGTKLFFKHADVIGISVSRSEADIRSRTERLIEQSQAILGTNETIDISKIRIVAEYAGTYGELNPTGKNAIFLASQKEGLLTDPIYTGKALGGLIELARQKRVDLALPTIFIHTGGAPILFAFHKSLETSFD